MNQKVESAAVLDALKQFDPENNQVSSVEEVIINFVCLFLLNVCFCAVFAVGFCSDCGPSNARRYSHQKGNKEKRNSKHSRGLHFFFFFFFFFNKKCCSGIHQKHSVYVL
jgi:hypothetical protein